MDTVTTEIQLSNGVTYQSPTHFISDVRSKKNSPNQDIFFESSGESLGTARDRSAVVGIRTSNKRNPFGSGNLSQEKGPNPSRGRKLALLSEMSCLIGENEEKIIVVLNSLTGMIQLDGKLSGPVCTPGEFCVRGGIVDVFPFSMSGPARISFLDEVVDVRGFDVQSQLTTGVLDNFPLLRPRIATWFH